MLLNSSEALRQTSSSSLISVPTPPILKKHWFPQENKYIPDAFGMLCWWKSRCYWAPQGSSLFFSIVKPPWCCPNCPPLKQLPQTHWGQDKGKGILKVLRQTSRLSPQQPWKRVPMQVLAWGAPLTPSCSNGTRGLHFPAQLCSPWWYACWSHIAVVADTFLRSLQAPAQLGTELQRPYHSWREQKLPGAGR